MSAHPVPVGLPLPPEVVKQELDHLVERRRLVFPAEPRPADDTGAGPPLPATAAADPYVSALTRLFRRAHRAKPFGVAFSGGGIRSATFNLGILQGLAEHNLVKHVDYLSTVSGGGYIGSWFHGLVRNTCRGNVSEATRFLSPTTNPVPAPPHEDPVSFLRKYSNYLAPRPGLFTTDIWVILLIWIRNVLLNQLILVPTVAAGVVALLVGGFAQQVIGGWLGGESPWGVEVPAFVVATVCLVWALGIIYPNLRRVVEQSFRSDDVPADQTDPGKRVEAKSLNVVPLVFVAAIALGCATRPIGSLARLLLIGIGLAVLLAIFQLGGGFIGAFASRHPGWSNGRAKVVACLHAVWMVPVTAAFTTALLWAWPHLIASGPKAAWLTVAFAPPLVCLSLIAGVGLLIGLMGADYPDAAREWITRVGAMIALLSAAWIAVFLLAVFGPWVVAWALKEYTLTAAAAIGAWLAAVGGGVIAGRSARTNGAANEPSASGRPLTILVGLVPTLFMIGYLVLVATAVHAALPKPPAGAVSAPTVSPQATYEVDVTSPQGPSKIRVDLRPGPPPNWVTRFVAKVSVFEGRYWKVLSTDNPAFMEAYWRAVSLGSDFRPLGFFVLLAVLVVVAAVASSRININEFSIHDFYKNRLVRCYLGASNSRRRKPNRLTGFDPHDDFRIATLVPERSYQGPFAIVNTTLNLNAGSELATQERKGAAFVFTPRVCGFAPSVTKEDQEVMRRQRDELDPSGYRATLGYSHPDGPNLGTALAISGAAANPNMGYNTSGPMAFLLTVFNVRLGWWLGNPRRPKQSRYPGPVFAWKYLIDELLGQTSARSKFVNLSDGGHFCNVGLYELARRRCRYVIIGDGEADPGLTFGSLGGAVRKVRDDFGVEVDIDPRPIQLVNGFSSAHCVMGTIHYPELELVDGSWRRARGYLFYLKASLVGDEPADVTQYRSENPAFPHQPTADQFFSESQFESYRRLGLHVARDAFEGLPAATDNSDDVRTMFEALDRKWYAPIPVTPERASRLADDYTELMTSLSKQPALVDFADELLTGTPAPTPPSRETVAAALAVIQLMENVFTEFRLEHPASQSNPRNGGWMKLFYRWAKAPTIKNQVWPKFHDDYNKLFQDFMTSLQTGTGSWDWEDRPARP